MQCDDDESDDDKVLKHSSCGDMETVLIHCL